MLSTGYQYFRYLIIGFLVGIFTLLAREAVAFVMPDSRAWYVAGAATVYGASVFLSYHLQRKHTFASTASSAHSRDLPLFFAVAMLTGGLVATLSYVIRYGLNLDALAGSYAPTVAFGAAAFCASIVNFVLNRALVFRERQP